MPPVNLDPDVGSITSVGADLCFNFPMDFDATLVLDFLLVLGPLVGEDVCIEMAAISECDIDLVPGMELLTWSFTHDEADGIVVL